VEEGNRPEIFTGQTKKRGQKSPCVIGESKQERRHLQKNTRSVPKLDPEKNSPGRRQEVPSLISTQREERERRGEAHQPILR